MTVNRGLSGYVNIISLYTLLAFFVIIADEV